MNEDLKRLVQLQKQKQDIISEIDALRSVLSKTLSPYKEGEKIKILSAHHHGKIGIVYESELTIDEDGIDFIVRVNVLRKDGSLSNYKAGWSSWRDPKLEDKVKEINKSLKAKKTNK